MRMRELQRAQRQLIKFMDQFAPLLGGSERGHWCRMYVSGFLLDGDRKSIEPMAGRLPGGNEQALQQFVNQSPWEHALVFDKLADDHVKYYVSNLPESVPLQQLKDWDHQRCTVEPGYQQLKEELGLDHFEGRSWRGLHHHVVLCFMASCFLTLVKHQRKKNLNSPCRESGGGSRNCFISGFAPLVELWFRIASGFSSIRADTYLTE